MCLTAAWKHPQADKHVYTHAEFCPALAQHILGSGEINSMMKLNTASTSLLTDTRTHIHTHTHSHIPERLNGTDEKISASLSS